MLIKYLLTLFYTHYYMGKNKLDMVGKKTKHKKKKLTKKDKQGIVDVPIAK